MPNLQAISRESHASKRWQRPSSYAFGAADSFVPLAAVELPKAVMSLPICFMERADNFILVALLSLQPGKNLFVAPDGRWAGPYIPAAFRAYPFRLAQTEDKQHVLCVDEDSGFVTEGPTGENFFTEDGEPSQAVLDIFTLLKQIEQSGLATVAACAALHQHKLIRPWPITVKAESGDQKIAGLFQVDEAALNELSGEALLELRQPGALLLAYCQLLSMQHLPLLGELTGAHAKVAARAEAAKNLTARKELDMALFDKGGTFRFGNLR